MGVALKQLGAARKDFVLSTKIWTCGLQPNDRFLSRKHIIEGLRNCLKRLQVDYVDIVFAHRPDYETPLEEQVRAFSWCIDQGMAQYWGTSEWPADRHEQACQIAEKYHLHVPVVEQCQYNMFERNKMESEYRTLFETRQMGTTIWSPLYGGALSGKYNEGTLHEGSRGQESMTSDKLGYLKPRWYKFFGPENIGKTTTMLQGIAAIAKDLGCTQA
jgi:aryl-alcohol dehydrogenase-like predicted oxidoreductase